MAFIFLIKEVPRRTTDSKHSICQAPWAAMELGKAARWHRIRMSKKSHALNVCGHHLSVSGWLMKRIASPGRPSASHRWPSFAVWRERTELGIRNIEKMNHSLGRNDVHGSKSALGRT